jgi:nucleobase:cation symporter-1, NCS1 family
MTGAEPTASSNPTFGVEQHGFDFIPETDRNMKMRDLVYVWVGANAYLFFFSVGVIAFGLGLNVWESLLAVLVGNALFAYVAWGSIAGVRAGLPTMTLTRAAFGVQGNRLNGVLGWVTSVSFEALNTVFGVLAIAALLPVLGWHSGGTAGKIIALVVVFFLSAGIAVLGHATMVYFQRIFAIMLTLVMVIVFFYTIGGVNWSAGPAHPLSTAATIGAFLAGTAVIASGPLSYMFNCSDWPRYLPSRTSSRSIFWNVLWSSSGIAIFLGFMGVILSSRADVSNPVAGLQSLIPEWLFILFAIAAVGGAVANNVITFYASGLTLQSVGVPLRRYQATMCDTTVATVLVIYVVFISTNFLTDVNDFLSLLLIWIGPFAGVWLVDGSLRRWSYDPVDIHAIRSGADGRYWGWHGINVKGFAAMLIGAGVCVLTINSPILQGPLSKALDGSDLTWILGPVVAGGIYYALARADVRASATVSAAHLEQALAMSEAVAIHEGLLPHQPHAAPEPHELRSRLEAPEPVVERSDA